MIYILDAYNVIHKIPALERLLDQDLRAARDGLVSLCARVLSQRADLSQMILVFDGKSAYRDLPQSAPPKIKIVFSETHEKADEKIVKILEGLSREGNKGVVSDDNFVRNHAKAYTARVISVAEFESLADKTKAWGAGNTPPAGADKKLTPQQADEITQAYKKSLNEKSKF